MANHPCLPCKLDGLAGRLGRLPERDVAEPGTVSQAIRLKLIKQTGSVFGVKELKVARGHPWTHRNDSSLMTR